MNTHVEVTEAVLSLPEYQGAVLALTAAYALDPMGNGGPLEPEVLDRLIPAEDFAVLPEHRGQGVGQKLLDAVERKARDTGCCRVTLEVQENNKRARQIYERSGFSQAVYGEATGGSLHYWKIL